MHIAVRYIIFAALATVVNIGTQAITWQLARESIAPDLALALSILVGTASGLVLKYILDKRWIFEYKPANNTQHLKSVVLYTLFSVGTTLIFWGFEFAAQWIFETDLARYLGGIIGLAIGYTAKYYVDKHITFASNPQQHKPQQHKPQTDVQE